MPMPTLAKIQTYFSLPIFDRGLEYFHNGRVRQVTVNGNVITALVQGSQYQPYQVVVHLDGAGKPQVVRCTCPYAAEHGPCKHAAAVLLQAANSMRVTPPQPDQIQATLALVADLNTEQLRQVVTAVLREMPEFADALVRNIALLRTHSQSEPSSPILLSAMLESAQRELRRKFGDLHDMAEEFSYAEFDYDDEYGSPPPFPADMLENQFELAGKLADQGEVDVALALLDMVLETWLQGVDDLPEWVTEEYPDDIDAINQELIQLLAAMLLRPEAGAEARITCAANMQKWLQTLPELELPLAAARLGWSHPPLLAVLCGETPADPIWGDVPNWVESFLVDFHLTALLRQERVEEYLKLAKAAGRGDLYVYRLAQMGRTEEAAAAATQALGTPSEYLHLARLLLEQGERKQGVSVAAQGLDLEDRRGRLELAMWLRLQAATVGDVELGLKAALLVFIDTCTLDSYRAVEQLAGAGWPELKPELLAHLARTARPELQINVYLAERMAPEAVAVAERYPAVVDLPAVLELAGPSQPDWCINLCLRRAEEIIQRGSADLYPEALPWLRRAQATYREHGRLDEWQAYITRLIEANRRKYTLTPLLRELG